MLGSRFENFGFCTDFIFHNPGKISSWTCALAKNSQWPFVRDKNNLKLLAASCSSDKVLPLDSF